MSKTRGKLADGTFRATSERPQASNSRPNLDIFGPKPGYLCGGSPPFLNWADILTVERAIVVLVKLGGNREGVSCRAPFFPHVLADISGCSWNFLRIPSMAGLLGLCPMGNPTYEHIWPLERFS